MSGAATPHAPTSARASMPPTGSATPALPPAVPAVPALPPPADFDFLPPLHKLLSRLITTSVQPPAPTPTPGQPKDDDGPIEVGQLQTKVSEVKAKIHKARRAVLALPDVDRSVEDQEDEIEDLEARIASLKAALQKLGQPANGVENEDTIHTPDCMQSLFAALGDGPFW
ncbi:hypothetical protein K491DRAFT_771967 [Lophiostoma macrostomum CBS 122681]|uniref:Mediator of RNA polymerase II transcription subunit 9 n=1 Tax=Lophiostoma macrostomum CBS 122681 TaxID=1314788 RepID=A0A6A6SNQ9_9PLEO|nr:hypothetical protein K491DRAFT_771967 [Lophiostoma macrostomum CBS 122681]